MMQHRLMSALRGTLSLVLLTLLAGCIDAPVTTTASPSPAITRVEPSAIPPTTSTLTPATEAAQVNTTPTVQPTQSAEAAPTSVPGTADQLHYLLPADFPQGYTLTSRDQTSADAAGFVLYLRPADAPAGPDHDLIIAGGAPAQATVAENVVDPNAQGAIIEPITVRGQTGTIASGGFGYTVAWTEQGQPYYVLAHGDREAIVAFIDALTVVDLATWQQRVAAAQ